ncbi:hypothetical protein EYR38_001223 [Pleurotus pulmonarius]|nr:hypothetical protein EYR38_001223 [Pleurotus pulmonarius]
MTRGNQREQDRLRAAKKAPAKKPKESATNLAKRKEADAEALRAKQKVSFIYGGCSLAVGSRHTLQKKEEEKAAAGSSGK